MTTKKNKRVPLLPTERQIKDAWVAFVSANGGVVPTVREVAQATGRSIGHVHGIEKQLVKKRHLDRPEGKARKFTKVCA